jgi:hypothetical protein
MAGVRIEGYARVRGQSQAIKDLAFGADPGGYLAAVEQLNGPTHFLLRPSDPRRLPGRTTTDPAALADCAAMAREDMKRFLGSPVTKD